ncbi:hypothetical protein SLE2022_093690 [Rubroshorea leprosula]
MRVSRGKLKPGPNQRIDDGHSSRNVAANAFNIYTEIGNVKVDADSLKSMEHGKGALLTTASNLKGSLKNNVKSKGKLETSANTDVRRKVLADVSNIKGNISRSVVCDGSKAMATEGRAAGPVNATSRKSFTGKGKNCLNQEGSKGGKASLDGRGTQTKNPALGSFIVSSSRARATGNSIIPMRKSLPVLRRSNQVDKKDSKENAGSLEKAKETQRATDDSKVSKKVLPRVSNARSHLCRTRASDGFIHVAPRMQTHAVVRPLSRRSVQPIVKTALRASIAPGALKPKSSSSLKKPVSVQATLYKEKEEAVKSSHVDDVVPVVPNGANQTDISSDANNNKNDNLTRRKSNRRRSYTSLLMARSKLLEKHGEVMEENQPKIDNASNQLEVAEYVDEIYQYYWNMEAQNPPPGYYMSIQTDIAPHMRGVLINWLIEVHFKFDLMQETLYLMVTLLDQYLSQVQIKRNEMQLVGLTALLLASKYEDFWHPRIKELISISAEAYTGDQMLGMEKLILKKLRFRLNSPTPYVFMLRFLKAAQSDTKLEHLAFFLIELCLVEYEALKFKSSLLCASAIYVARCTLQITPAWTPLLRRHARYDVSEMRECAEMILRFQRAASSGQLKVTYEKYTSPDLSGVAAITPLHQLPL